MFLVTFTEKDITVLLMIYSCMLFLSLIFRQGNACKYPYVAIFMFLQVLAMILAIVIYGVAWAEPKVESHGFLYSVSSFVVGLQGGGVDLTLFSITKKKNPNFF